MIAALFAVLLVGTLLGRQLPAAEEAGPVPAAGAARQVGTARQAGTGSQDGGEMVLRRDSSGQFSLVAQVNGEDVTFLVDTGADVVALTVEDAQQLGLDVDPESFEAVGQTASGIGYGTPVRLERIEVGGEQFNDVEAVVMDGLTTNLLGQSVLRRLGRVELQGDRMVIHPVS